MLPEYRGHTASNPLGYQADFLKHSLREIRKKTIRVQQFGHCATLNGVL
jgi:hypothetical protein